MKKAEKKSEPAMPAVDPKWETEDDMRTMMRMEEIKASPDRLKRLHAHAKKHAKIMTSISDLKAKYAEMVKPGKKVDGDE